MYGTPAAIRRRGGSPLIIPSAEDFVFSDWLAGLGVVDGDVVATLPVGNTIGGTVDGAYAFEVGDITPYDSVVINIQGEIQGRGGDPDGGNGSHGLHSDHALTLNVTGAILAGGGGGGAGGAGAQGIGVDGEVDEQYSLTNPYAYFIPEDTAGADLCEDPDNPTGWKIASYAQPVGGGSHAIIGYPCGHDMMGLSNFYRLFRKGTFKTRTEVEGHTVDVYSILVADYKFGTSTPGVGGKGQGYEGPATTGVAGSSTYGSGAGGKGGDGGAWGTDGTAGSAGANGVGFQTFGLTHPNSTAYYRADLGTPNTDVEQGKAGGVAGTDLDVPSSSVVNYN